MTLTATTVKHNYNGDGTTTSFNINFVFWETTDIKAILTDSSGVDTDWSNGTQYTLTGGEGSTGTLEVEISPTDYTPQVGEILTIKSNLPNTQNTSFPAGGPFPSSAVEQRFDKNVRLTQQRTEELGRSIKLKESSLLSGIEFPDPGAGKYIRWNVGGTALETVSDLNDSGSFLQSGSGAVSRTITSKLAEWFSVKDFGAVGDGITDDKVAIDNAVAAWQANGAGAHLYFPPGTYYGGAGVTIQTSADNQTISGAGFCSIIDKVTIQVKHSHIFIEKLFFSGGATYGILLDDEASPALSTRQNTRVESVFIKDKTYAMAQLDTGFYSNFVDCMFRGSTTANIYLAVDNAPGVVDRGDMILTNCQITSSLGDGILAVAIGTLNLNGCKVQGNLGYGLYAKASSNTNDKVAQIFSNNTSYEGAGNQTLTHSITAFADAGNGRTTVTTSTPHLLRNGMYNGISISGTTNYDGSNLVVWNVTSTTFEIEKAFVADDATGTLKRDNWDVYLASESDSTRVSDCVFQGGDINRLYIDKARNISFMDTRIKLQRHVTANAELINFTGFREGFISESSGNSGSVGPVPVDPVAGQRSIDIIASEPRRNELTNPNFDAPFWKRGTSFTIGSSASAYTADRWVYRGPTTGNGTVSRQAFTLGQTAVLGEPVYYVNITRLGDAAWFGQKIEDVRKFAGLVVAISFYAKAASDYTLPARIEQNFGSGGDAAVSQSTNLNLITSWKKFSWIVSLASISGKTLGTNHYINAFVGQATVDNVAVDLSRIKVEQSPQITEFVDRPIMIEEEMANRYTISAGYMLHGEAISTTNIVLYPSFPVEMRTTPTATLLDTTPTITEIGVGDKTGTASTIASSTLGKQGGYLEIDGFTGLTAGNKVQVKQDDLILFDAEI